MTENWVVIVFAVIGVSTLALGAAWCVAKCLRLFERMSGAEENIRDLRRRNTELVCAVQELNHRMNELEKGEENAAD